MTALGTHRQYFSQENASPSGRNHLIISSLEKSHAAVSSHPPLFSMKASHAGVQYETNTRQLNSSLHRQAADPLTGSAVCSYTQFLLSGRSPNPVTGSGVCSYTQFLLSVRSPKRPCCSRMERVWSFLGTELPP